jgi:hypothetical protein
MRYSIRQQDLATMISFLNHTLKLRKLGTYRVETGKQEKNEDNIKPRKLILMPSITIF